MQAKKQLLTYLSFILLATLYQGCSGHTLQDLVDGKTDKETPSTSTKNTTTDPKPVTPSQNKALNSISPSSTASDEHEEHRYLQKSTNAWIKNEWEPLTDSNTSTSKEPNQTDQTNNMATKSALTDSNTSISSDDINSTGLQYYVDKVDIYMENKKKRDANKTEEPSHVDKINAMPGIGKSKRR